jgi:hypothetical protein
MNIQYMLLYPGDALALKMQWKGKEWIVSFRTKEYFCRIQLSTISYSGRNQGSGARHTDAIQPQDRIAVLCPFKVLLALQEPIASPGLVFLAQVVMVHRGVGCCKRC